VAFSRHDFALLACCLNRRGARPACGGVEFALPDASPAEADDPNY